MSESRTVGILYDKYNVTRHRDKRSHASFTIIAISTEEIFVFSGQTRRRLCDNCDARACLRRVLFSIYQLLNQIDKLWAQRWRIYRGKNSVSERYGIWTMYIHRTCRSAKLTFKLMLQHDVKSREIMRKYSANDTPVDTTINKTFFASLRIISASVDDLSLIIKQNKCN